jgi:hypothetical protein
MGLMMIVVPIAITVLSVAPVFEHRNFARRAAAEAARTAVLAVVQPLLAAADVVSTQAVAMGIDPADVSVVFCDGLGCSWERGGVITVEVAVVVREVSDLLPLVEITVRAAASEQIDPFRSRP